MMYKSIQDEESCANESRKSSTKSKWRQVGFTLVIFILGLYIGHAATEAIKYDQNGQLNRNTFATRFTSNLTFMSLDHGFDHLWDVKRIMGFARLRMPDDETPEVDMPVIITMLHQLHCLSAIREALQNAHDGIPIGFNARDNGHWPHCLDYLRNAILCNADNTIEAAAIVDGQREAFIDGSGTWRQCKSTDHIFAITRGEDFRFNVTYNTP